MRELSKEEIQKNGVETLKQYHILNYLKKNLNIESFKIYLVNRNFIKVVDKKNKYLFFSYDKPKKEVNYQEELLEKKYEKGL